MDHFTTFSQLLGIKMTKYILKLISHCSLIYMKKEDKLKKMSHKKSQILIATEANAITVVRG